MIRKREQIFLTGRPTLVSELQSAGHKAQVRPNPWEDGKHLWAFTMDDDLVRIVEEYCKVNEIPIPVSVIAYSTLKQMIKQGKQLGENDEPI